MSRHPETAGGKACRPYWQKMVFVLCLGWTVLWIHRTVLSPILPELRAELNISSDASIGLIASVFFLAYTLMQIPSGFLGDRFGKVAVLVPGLLLFGTASIGAGLASSFTLLLVARFLTGVGQATYYGPAYSLSSETIPRDKRALATAVINSGTAIGMAIGLIGSTYWVKVAHWNWRGLLFISGALAIVTAFIFKRVLADPCIPVPGKSAQGQSATRQGRRLRPASRSPRPAGPVRTPGSAAAQHTASRPAHHPQKSGVLALLANPRMLAAYFLYFATCYGYYMTVTWLPAYLEKERGFQGGAIGFASSLVAFSAIPGALLFSRLADRFSHRKILFIVALELMAAITLYMIVTAVGNTGVVVSLILYGFIGKIAVEPLLISHMADMAPATSLSTTFGVFNFFGMSSSVAAPWITGIISDTTGSKILGFYLAAILVVAATVTTLLTSLKVAQPARAPQEAGA